MDNKLKEAIELLNDPMPNYSQRKVSGNWRSLNPSQPERRAVEKRRAKNKIAKASRKANW